MGGSQVLREWAGSHEPGGHRAAVPAGSGASHLNPGASVPTVKAGIPSTGRGTSRTRIVGCGARDRGDDATGLLAAEALRRLLPAGIEVIQDLAGGARLPDWCRDVDKLILIDAAQATPAFPRGAVLRMVYPADRDRLARTLPRGTHAFSLVDGLRLAEALGQLPSEVVLFLLAGDAFEPGTGFSADFHESLARLVNRVRAEIGA